MTKGKKSSWRSWLRDGLVIIFLLSVLTYWQTKGLVSSGNPAPPLQGTTLSGAAFDLNQLHGKRVLVYFFAPWCTVCKFSASNLKTVRSMTGENTLIYAVALDYKDEESIRVFATDHDIPADQVVVGTETVQTAFSVNAYPTYYTIGADGKITGSSVGYATLLGMLVRIWLT